MADERTVLLNRIQVCDFALNDAALYLDINPDDQTALEYFKKYSAMRNEAANIFVAKYGPLTRADYSGEGSWKWVDGPWPWQKQEEK